MLCFRVALQVLINYLNATNTGTSLYVLMAKASQNIDNIRMLSRATSTKQYRTAHTTRLPRTMPVGLAGSKDFGAYYDVIVYLHAFIIKYVAKALIICIYSYFIN